MQLHMQIALSLEICIKCIYSTLFLPSTSIPKRRIIGISSEQCSKDSRTPYLHRIPKFRRNILAGIYAISHVLQILMNLIKEKIGLLNERGLII